MKPYIHILLTIVLAACGMKKSDDGLNKTDSIAALQTSISNDSNIALREDSVSDYATFFVLVADTSPDYYLLHKKMFSLNRQLNLDIDTMGRFYNQTKNLIALPDDDDDEMYAGNYFPRRFPSENLSLEYLEFYQSSAGEKAIALVTGIFTEEKNADSALAVLQTTEKRAFKLKANIYVGCMH